MASVSGGDRKAKPSSCREVQPELSLSWCLAHLSKPKPPKSDSQAPQAHGASAKRAAVAQWRALVAIRTHHIKGHRSSISRFRRQGGLELLLGLIRQTDCSRKTLDLALSILGNCCTERETRGEVRKLDGINIVVEVMRKHVALLSIQNRAARVLGNLAMDPENSALIHAAGGVPLLLLCVSQASSASSPSPSITSATASSASSPSTSSPSPPPTPTTKSSAPTPPLTASPTPPPAAESSPGLDCAAEPSPGLECAAEPSPGLDCSAEPSPGLDCAAESSPGLDCAAESSPGLECAQSAARALFYLSDSASHRLTLVSQGAVASLCPLLSPERPRPLRRAVLRAVHELSKGCGVDCARQMIRCGALSHLGTAAVEEEEELALKTLANLCSQGCLRPLVGSLDVIGRFAAEVKKDGARSGLFLRALCLCCKEAVNRAKVKECGGLELLTGFLASHPNHPLSRCVIQACVDFVFDEAAVEQFLELGLVPLLVERLVQLSRGEEPGCTASSNLPLPDILPQGGLDSYDFPQPEERREQGSSSFLSLRSWLLSEGLISSEGDLLDSSSTAEPDWSGLSLSSPPPANTTATATTATTTTTTTATATPSPAEPPPSSPSSSPVKTPLSPSRFRLCSPSLRRRPREKPRVATETTPTSRVATETTPTSRVATEATPTSATRPASSNRTYTEPVCHPYHPEPWTAESPLLLLLSRFSHVSDPSAALTGPGVVSGLLLYLTSRADPSGRCSRMLLRLSENPLCLQGLARSGAAALIRYRLCDRGEGEEGEEREEREERERQSPRVKAKVRQLGLSLLSNLQLQCESGFGTGVLSHLMLSGSESDRLHCALSLPLITSNKTLLRKLLLDSGGLQFALQPLGGDTDSDQTGQTQNPRPDLSLRSLYCPLLIGCLSALTAGSKSASKLNFSSKNENVQPPPEKKPRFDRSHCPYSASKFNLTFLLDDGTEIPANHGAVSGEETSNGSEYFRALLKGGFGEAQSKGAIPIRDVSGAMLTPVLHYLHGCRFFANANETRASERCPTLGAVVKAGLSRDEDFEKSAVGEAMVGACRFLVDDLRKDLEEVCVSLLNSDNDFEKRTREDFERNAKSPERKSQESVIANVKQTRQNGASILDVLPGIYWFSQRYSYARLGGSCVSALASTRFSQSEAGECLKRLAKEADCVDALKKDLLALAAEALS